MEAELEAIKREFGTDNPDVLLRELNKFEDFLRDIINANPNLHLNDIVPPYNINFTSTTTKTLISSRCLFWY